MSRIEGKKPEYTPPRGRTRALPLCTREEINYELECITCRKAGVKRRYFGESGRSGFQRGCEHVRHITAGAIEHPLVQHMLEEHDGVEQPTIMRISSTHKTALERQVESP